MEPISKYFLLSKLNPPQPNIGQINRQYLYGVLNHGLNKKLTFVNAPAGFGKTSLVSAWLRQIDIPYSWLNLDEQDNRFDRFLIYLTNSLHITCLDYSSHPNFESDSDSVNAIISQIIQEINSRQSYSILVIDNIHVINNISIQNFLNQLINNLPHDYSGKIGNRNGVHIVLISRSNSPFPLSRFRLADEICEVGTKELIFTETETKILLQQMLSMDVSTEDALILTNKCEGWAAGIQLAALTYRGQSYSSFHQFVLAFNGGFSRISEYLVEEVFSKESPEVQSFLTETSILENLTGSLCDRVTGNDNGQILLDYLEKSNLFIIPIDSSKEWYRFHQLFSDALIKHCDCLGEYRQKELHTRAALWFEEKGIIERCLFHYISAGRIRDAVRVLTPYAYELLREIKGGYLDILLAMFPEKTFYDWPWLCIFKAWILFWDNPELAEYWLTVAENRILDKKITPEIQDEDKKRLFWRISTIRALSASQYGDYDKAGIYSSLAISCLPDEEGILYGLTKMVMADVVMANGDLTEASKLYRQVTKELRRRRDTIGVARAMSRLGEIYYYQSHLRSAVEVFVEILSIDKRINKYDFPVSFQSNTCMGLIQYEWNNLAQAFYYLEEGIRICEKLNYKDRISSKVALFNVCTSMGDLEKASALYENLNQPRLIADLTPLEESTVAAARLNYFTKTKNSKLANQLISDRNMLDIDPNNLPRESENMAVAKYLFSIGSMKEAISLTHKLETEMAKGGRVDRRIKTLILQAAAYYVLQNNPLALKSLALSIHLGAAEGYLRSYLEYDEIALELIMHAINPDTIWPGAQPEIEYLTRIGSILVHTKKDAGLFSPNPSSSESPLPRVSLIEPLSLTEIKVLRLLISGRQKSEIARELGVSINTIKTHVNNIYNKLGVHNKVEAVNIARRLRIV
jgi:LuxR family maltose regulon positive regulatory protein